MFMNSNALDADRKTLEMTNPKTTARLGFWITTAIFAFFMTFTAYNELASPLVGQEFARLGFPSHAFRVELSIAKILGVMALLLPFVPSTLKEWAYAGFTINLMSALIAHLAAGDDPAKWIWAVGFWVLLASSYGFRMKLAQQAPEK
jgi:hypothetical protein